MIDIFRLAAMVLCISMPTSALAIVALPPQCAIEQLDMRFSGASLRFSIEVVETPEERAIGLMNRTSLAPFSGMLFVYPKPQSVSFWMRNTLIPLDMIFIDARGVVKSIHENAIPLDETPIFGGDDIQYVFEINGGMAESLGISVGAELRHPSISGENSIWPCN